MSAARSLAVVREPIPFSGSTAGRADLCPPSCLLPRADSHGEAAEDGVQLHAYLAIVSLSPASKSEALRALPERLRERAAEIDVASILDGYEVHGVEMSYAYDVDTGAVRELGMNKARRDAYQGLSAREIGCTLDIVATKRGRPTAKDWKTGRTDYGPAEEAWQLKIAGLVLRAVTGADEVDVSFDYIELDGGHHAVAATFGPFDLDQAAEDLRALVARVDGLRGVLPKNLNTFEGDHCKYCPAFNACPSKHRLARAMASAHAPELVPTDEEVHALSPIEQGRLWRRVRAFLEVAERVEGTLKEAARRHRIPLENGKCVGAVEVRGRMSFDKDRALELLTQHGASEAEIASLSRRGQGHVQVRELKV